MSEASSTEGWGGTEVGLSMCLQEKWIWSNSICIFVQHLPVYWTATENICATFYLSIKIAIKLGVILFCCFFFFFPNRQEYFNTNKINWSWCIRANGSCTMCMLLCTHALHWFSWYADFSAGSRRQKLDAALVKMIVMDAEPFSIVEDEGFKVRVFSRSLHLDFHCIFT